MVAGLTYGVALSDGMYLTATGLRDFAVNNSAIAVLLTIALGSASNAGVETRRTGRGMTGSVMAQYRPDDGMGFGGRVRKDAGEAASLSWDGTTLVCSYPPLPILIRA